LCGIALDSFAEVLSVEKNYEPYNGFEQQITDELFLMQDKKYLDFHARLIPTVDKSRIIGVRTPQLRAYAGKLKKDGRREEFLSLRLPHFYYEQMNLRAFLIEQEKDFRRALELTGDFLPHIDNWATCDMFAPKIFAAHTEELALYVRRWLESENTYTVRYGLVTLLRFYLDGAFDPRQLEWAADVISEEYYINMAAAWYFSMALVKQYDSALPYIAERRLTDQVHNKTIQKACESRQISPEVKQYLRSFRIR
jgi:3-methyladenine DNA glycosylase AlkD